MSPFVDVMSQAFESELRKIAAAKVANKGSLLGTLGKAITSKEVLLPAGGIVGWEALRRANRDRKLGKQLRAQQRY